MNINTYTLIAVVVFAIFMIVHWRTKERLWKSIYFSFVFAAVWPLFVPCLALGLMSMALWPLLAPDRTFKDYMSVVWSPDERYW